MAERKDWDDLDKGQKGDWYFANNDTYIVLRFGDTMDDVVVLPIAPIEKQPFWQWDGIKEAPTLSPSILVHGGKGQPDRWHGFLRAGKLETA